MVWWSTTDNDSRNGAAATDGDFKTNAMSAAPVHGMVRPPLCGGAMLR